MASDENLVDEATRLTALGARYEAQFIEKIRDSSIEQGASTSKWLSASLLAINGAGALAAFNAFERLDTTLAAALFLSGTVAALASGWFNQTFAFDQLENMNRVHAFWIGTAETGVLDVDKQNSLQPIVAEMSKHGKRGPRAGWLSLLAFVAASGSLPFSHARRDHANDRRCEAIQRDMLSAHPKRSDDTAIFEALSCKPQGAGSVYAPRSGPSSSG
jgi:hypothetical protein